MMQIIYAGEPMPKRVVKSIFLAGPTPRDQAVPSWRTKALELLETKLGYDGTVFVPEDRSGVYRNDYNDQVEWEKASLDMADLIVFWIPRILPHLPGFTTNVEYGRYASSRKVLLGAPDEASKIRYLKWLAVSEDIPFFDNLKTILETAVMRLGEGAERQNAECEIPLVIWQSQSFQIWYEAIKASGNRLDGAKVEWLFYTKTSRHLYCWILHVKIWIESEQRHKSNEIIISRPDIFTTVIYRGNEVVLVREFRSPGDFVYDLPGGSTTKLGLPPAQIAAEEIHEETGVSIPADRLQDRGRRLVTGTFATHGAHLFSVEASESEMDEFRAQAGIAQGNEGDSERTYVEVHQLDKLPDMVDWSIRGMVYEVLLGPTGVAKTLI